MATIGSISSSSTSNIYGSQRKGIGGLASGLDTDSLIDGMTSGTKAKIAKQLQNKTLLSWKSEAYRSISSKLIEFSDKYISYTSSTNLYSEKFFDKTLIKVLGENSKYITVSGSTSSSSKLTINGVKQLASNASFTSNSAISNNYLKTDNINFNDEEVSTVVGKKMKIKYGSETYTITIPPKEEGGVYKNADELTEGIKNALKEVTIKGGPNDGKTLDTVFNVTSDGKKLTFSKTNDSGGNNLSIESADRELVKALGLTVGEGDNESTIIGENITTGTTAKADVEASNLMKTVTFAERVKGKTLTFEYNGIKKTIKFDDETKLNSTDFKSYIQDQLDSQFGKGRIRVSDDGGAFKFETITPDNKLDNSSVLKITDGSVGLTGDGSVFGIKNGTSNKINLNAILQKSGIKGAENITLGPDDNVIRINGVDITIDLKDGKATVADIISAINKNEKAGVKITYMENSDTFSIESTQSGAAGSVKIGDGSGGGLNNLEKLLFGEREVAADGSVTIKDTVNGTEVSGKDAIILVDFDGAGGIEPVEVVRSTNSFVLDGLNINVNGTFGYNGNDPISGTETIKFDAKVDTDKVFNAVKDMINDYNELIEYTNNLLKEKRNRDYPPLTDEQKKEMSDDEIKAWEEKAKAGMLFGDSDVVSLTNELRFVFLNTRSDGLSFADIGITVSDDWKENGKIKLDETKLKAVLEERPEDVKKLFTEETDKSSTSTSSSLTTGGVMARMKSVVEKYASTNGSVKGVFVEKAGHSKSPSSMLKNTLFTQMQDIDKIVDSLKTKLAKEEQRYQRQFTALEQLVSQMNSQSSWLTHQFGGQ